MALIRSSNAHTHLRGNEFPNCIKIGNVLSQLEEQDSHGLPRFPIAGASTPDELLRLYKEHCEKTTPKDVSSTINHGHDPIRILQKILDSMYSIGSNESNWNNISV